jgi:hypothetical protein
MHPNREGQGEALTGECTSRVLSREIETPVRKRWEVPGAPVLEISEGLHLGRRYRETLRDLARSKTPCEYGRTLYGNRESSRSPAQRVSAGRIGKSKDARR